LGEQILVVVVRVKITTALHYGTFDAELEDSTGIEDLFHDRRDDNALVSFYVTTDEGQRLRVTMRKKHINAVEEEV
jgi:hypothetical protein